MFVELHILQNFAPSNLNRDDTGAPKDCEFGGYRRARISSQCLKRAIRSSFRQQKVLPEGNLGARTKRLVDELVKRLEEAGKPQDQARAVVEAVVKGAGLGVKDDRKTEYLLFLGEAEIAAFAKLCTKHWEELSDGHAGGALAAASPGAVKSAASAKETKKAGREAVPAEVRKALEQVLDGGRAADLALFGRMLADLPDKNVDAACQVAHALSTNKASMEFDFYTAVDDFKPEDTAGADMMGTVEFNSACFYRYANVDMKQLTKNLGGGKEGEELAGKTLEAFLRASVTAVPTGKQNSMAAQNPPSLILVVVRRSGLWSLANAFAKPVRPDAERDLVQNSARSLDAYWGQLEQMYGQAEVAGKWVAALDGEALHHLKAAQEDNFEGLVQKVVQAAFETSRDGGA